MKRGLSSISHIHSYQRPSEAAVCANQTLMIRVPITSENQISFLQAIAHMHNFVILEGLFRKPGNKLRIEQLLNELGKSGVNGVIANTHYTGHDYASVLKQILSELPEPLLVKRHLDAYIQASGKSCTTSCVMPVCLYACIKLLISPILIYHIYIHIIL